MTSTALALMDAVDELDSLEAVAVDALAEAATWRQLALMALAHAQVATARAETLERRVRQILGQEPWHTAAEMAS